MFSYDNYEITENFNSMFAGPLVIWSIIFNVDIKLMNSHRVCVLCVYAEVAHPCGAFTTRIVSISPAP